MQEKDSIVIKYNTPIEVTKEQYKVLMIKCRGIVAGHESDDGKFYIKVWAIEYADMVREILNSKPTISEPVTSLSGKT